jgi:hypothetical protein
MRSFQDDQPSTGPESTTSGRFSDVNRHTGRILHNPVLRRLQRYLSFVHEGKVYSYRALPFGLSISPRTFSKVMTYPRKVLGHAGIQSVNSLDDLLLRRPSLTEAMVNTAKAVQILQSLGFLINHEKSQLSPSRETTLPIPGPFRVSQSRPAIHTNHSGSEASFGLVGYSCSLKIPQAWTPTLHTLTIWTDASLLGWGLLSDT